MFTKEQMGKLTKCVHFYIFDLNAELQKDYIKPSFKEHMQRDKEEAEELLKIILSEEFEKKNVEEIS